MKPNENERELVLQREVPFPIKNLVPQIISDAAPWQILVVRNNSA